MGFSLLNIQKFIRRTIIPEFRIDMVLDFTAAILKPLEQLWTTFLAFRTQILLDLSINITVESMQARLRVLYPNVSAYKCYVTTANDNYPWQYVKYIGEHHLQEYDYYLDELPVSYGYYLMRFKQKPHGIDYTVTIPVAYDTAANRDAIVVLLNKYRPAGKYFLLTFSNMV